MKKVLLCSVFCFSLFKLSALELFIFVTDTTVATNADTAEINRLVNRARTLENGLMDSFFEAGVVVFNYPALITAFNESRGAASISAASLEKKAIDSNADFFLKVQINDLPENRDEAGLQYHLYRVQFSAEDANSLQLVHDMELVIDFNRTSAGAEGLSVLRQLAVNISSECLRVFTL